MRTGDTVRHRPSGEKWLVGWADKYSVIACGWPETLAKPEDVEMVRACTDEEHWAMVRAIAQSQSGDSLKRVCCISYLEERLAAECAAMMHL